MTRVNDTGIYLGRARDGDRVKVNVTTGHRLRACSPVIITGSGGTHTGQSAQRFGLLTRDEGRTLNVMMGRVVLVLVMLAGSALACDYAMTPEQDQLVADARHDAALLAPVDSHGDDIHGLAVAFALMGLCGLAFAITRDNAVRRTFATSRQFDDAELDVAQAVAQISRRRAVVFLAGCTVAQAGVAILPIDPFARGILATAPLVLFAAGLGALLRLQRVLAVRPDSDVRITSHGNHLFASQGGELVGWVAAPPALIARASGLPSARILR
jgi:hypothetical protein